jgi:hypothetical protein
MKEITLDRLDVLIRSKSHGSMGFRDMWNLTKLCWPGKHGD